MSSMEQGKNPPINLIHASRAEANNYVGLPGQITLVGRFTDQNVPVIDEVRFHNGLLPGGFLMSVSPTPQGNDPSMGPPARVKNVGPQAFAENQTVMFVHNFGYLPGVVAIDNSAQPVAVTVNFVTFESISITFPATAVYALSIR